MFGQTILILPLGLLPIFFIIGYLIYTRAEEGLQRKIGGTFRQGITEYPTAISLILCGGGNKNSIEFTNNGKSVILIFPSPWSKSINDAESALQYIKDTVWAHGEHHDRDWIDFHVIERVSYDADADILRITATLPDSIVLADEYFEYEIGNIGRVFKTNNAPGNDTRWLLFSRGEKKVVRKDGRVFVYIDRLQLVEGFMSEKDVVMSEKQITRNIKNRLWNRFDVKCISIDEKTYCGEIIYIDLQT